MTDDKQEFADPQVVFKVPASLLEKVERRWVPCLKNQSTRPPIASRAELKSQGDGQHARRIQSRLRQAVKKQEAIKSKTLGQGA